MNICIHAISWISCYYDLEGEMPSCFKRKVLNCNIIESETLKYVVENQYAYGLQLPKNIDTMGFWDKIFNNKTSNHKIMWQKAFIRFLQKNWPRETGSTSTIWILLSLKPNFKTTCIRRASKRKIIPNLPITQSFPTDSFKILINNF